MSLHRIRVLVVDDSHFMRRAISKILEEDGRFEVVGQASDGAQALELVQKLQPDAVTMDYNMPIMNGVDAVRRIMATRPTPIVMISAHTSEGARQTLDALEAGAVDFVTKPSGEVSADISRASDLVVRKVLEAATATVAKTTARQQTRRAVVGRGSMAGRKIVIIGVSTGGPVALSRMLPQIPRRTNLALVVVQHMPATFTAALAHRLDGLCTIKVAEARPGDRPKEGTALVAPGGRHLEFDERGLVVLTQGPPINGCRPSVDVTMSSAAGVFGRQAVGVLMTGMGRDGAEGMAAIKAAGGKTLAQDRRTSLIFGMPKAAIDRGVVDAVVGLDDIAKTLQEI